MRYCLFVLVLLSVGIKAQIITANSDSVRIPSSQDTLVIDSGEEDSLKIFKPTIEDYRFQTQFSVKKVFDTILTADKSYRFSQYNNPIISVKFSLQISEQDFSLWFTE